MSHMKNKRYCKTNINWNTFQNSHYTTGIKCIGLKCNVLLLLLAGISRSKHKSGELARAKSFSWNVSGRMGVYCIPWGLLCWLSTSHHMSAEHLSSSLSNSQLSVQPSAASDVWNAAVNKILIWCLFKNSSSQLMLNVTHLLPVSLNDTINFNGCTLSGAFDTRRLWLWSCFIIIDFVMGATGVPDVSSVFWHTSTDAVMYFGELVLLTQMQHIKTMAKDPRIPAVPTIQVRRKKRMTPRMFCMHGRYTPMNVPICGT